jgi:hypothetical protein
MATRVVFHTENTDLNRLFQQLREKDGLATDEIESGKEYILYKSSSPSDIGPSREIAILGHEREGFPIGEQNSFDVEFLIRNRDFAAEDQRAAFIDYADAENPSEYEMLLRNWDSYDMGHPIIEFDHPEIHPASNDEVTMLDRIYQEEVSENEGYNIYSRETSDSTKR